MIKVKLISILTLTVLIGLGANAQNCSKNLERNDSYSSGPLIQSKDLIFHSPTISNTKDISFIVKDSSRIFVHFDITYGTWRVGSKIEFTFESGSSVTTYITNWEAEQTGSYSAKRYDAQIGSRDDLDKFYLENIQKINVTSEGRTYDFSFKKASKLNQFFKCTADAVGIDNINFRTANKSQADPYVDNTIVVSFGNNNQQSNYDNVNCEYEKNEVDEFTGNKTTITKMAVLGANLNGQAHHINGKTFLNFAYTLPMGCVNVDSYVIILFADGSTEKLLNVSKEDCGSAPMLKVEITDKMSIFKVRDIEKIRIVMTDGTADVILNDREFIKGLLHKCI